MGMNGKRLSIGKRLLGEVSIYYDTTIYILKAIILVAKKEFSKEYVL